MTQVQIMDSFGGITSVDITENQTDMTKVPVKTKEEFLKDYIVELEIKLVKSKIPKGHCPFRYQTVSKLQWETMNCHNIDCEDCEKAFYENLEEDIKEKVSKM